MLPDEKYFSRFARVTELVFTFMLGSDLPREAAAAAAIERQERREKVVRRPDIFRTRHDHVADLAITQTAPRVIGARMTDGPCVCSCPQDFDLELCDLLPLVNLLARRKLRIIGFRVLIYISVNVFRDEREQIFCVQVFRENFT